MTMGGGMPAQAKAVISRSAFILIELYEISSSHFYLVDGYHRHLVDDRAA